MSAATITLCGRTVTAADVRRAVAELDELGCVRFLRRYGYRQASRFHLRINGRSYPSKAILGVAAGLEPSQFFGGAAGAAASLTRLGFQVRNSKTGALMSRELDSLRRACEKEGLAVSEKPWPATDVVPTAYFASGSNRAAEIRGLSRAGADIGVAAPELSPVAERELHALAGSDVQVFVDSGAFSEMDFRTGAPVVAKPMTDADWRAVLALYGRLSRSLGDQVWIVAPDRVGCQETTLRRLETYRDELAELHALGARVLVVMQRGEMPQAAFADAVDRVLGFSGWVPALPCNKAATKPAEVALFVAQRRPAHVHLLGLGIRSRQLSAYLAPFKAAASVSLDSCWITANSGRTNGPGGGPRRLTRARDVARGVLERLNVARVAVAELATYCCLATGLVR